MDYEQYNRRELRAFRVQEFHKVYIRLLPRYGSFHAYRMMEKLHKHRHKERLFKNYESFRRSIVSPALEKKRENIKKSLR